MLAKGHSLAESVKIANAAASIAIQHSLNGVPQCPTYDEAVALVTKALKDAEHAD